jgi:hypothetical protein
MDESRMNHKTKHKEEIEINKEERTERTERKEKKELKNIGDKLSLIPGFDRTEKRFLQLSGPPSSPNAVNHCTSHEQNRISVNKA